MNDPTIGHNQPPTILEHSKDVTDALKKWINDFPVVQSDEDARSAKLMLDRGNDAIREIESERKAKSDPHRLEVERINEIYKSHKTPIERLIGEIKTRVGVFIRAEEARRREAAEAARRAAEEAAERARKAEEAEREAIEEASHGSLDANAGQATLDADEAFAEYQKAERAAKRAEKETDVKIGGGFRRRLSLRQHKEIVVIDWRAAIDCMGMTSKINEAIKSSAREYLKAAGDLPEGTGYETEERL